MYLVVYGVYMRAFQWLMLCSRIITIKKGSTVNVGFMRHIYEIYSVVIGKFTAIKASKCRSFKFRARDTKLHCVQNGVFQ
jgi:hypothetical protein